MYRCTACLGSLGARRWRRDLVAQALLLSSYHHPPRRAPENRATKAWMAPAPDCVPRRRYSLQEDPLDVAKYFRSWRDREEEYLAMDVVIYLKTALMEIAADKRPSKIVLGHPAYHSLRQYIVNDARDQSTKNLAFVLWLCARYKLKDTELLQVVIAELEKRNPELLSDRQLGIVPWSLTVLGYHDTAWSLIETCTNETIERINQGLLCDHYTVSQLCWSFATKERWPRQFTGPLSNYINKYIRDFAPHTLSTITWALQKSGLGDLAQLTKHTQIANSNFSESNIQSHSMMLWSLGNAHYFDRPYFEKLTEEILSGKFRNDMDPLMLSVMLWSFARVGYHHYDLLELLSATAIERINEFSIKQISRLAHSFCHLNHISRELVDVASKTLCNKYTGKKGLGEAYPAMEMAYACLVCNHYPPELLHLILELLKDEKVVLNELGWKNLQWIMQFAIALSIEHPELEAPPLPVVYKLGLLHLRMQTYFTTPVSLFRGRVRKCLQVALKKTQPSLKYTALTTSAYTIDLEVLLDKNDQPLIPARTSFTALRSNPDACLRGVFSNFKRSELLEKLAAMPNLGRKPQLRINFASDWAWDWSELASRRIAVEIDGPQRFSVNDQHPLGRSALKKRQLRALGWEVIEVPHYKWEERSMGPLVNYLHQKIFGTPA